MDELRRSARGGAAVSRKAPPPAGGGGGMPSYDDVFGGPPRFSGPFVSRMTDYAEVFGGLASSCSIPVLDLPPALDGYGDAFGPGSSGIDYSEIFGGFGGGDFGLSYEELVAEGNRVERETEAEASSSSGRDPKEAEFGEHEAEVSEFSSDGANGDHASFLENTQVSSDSIYLDDGSRKLNISYHKVSRGNIEESVTERIQETQLRAVPGFTFDVDENSTLQNLRSDSPSRTVSNGLNHSTGLNGIVTDWKLGKESSSTSSGASPKCSENDINRDQKPFATECLTPEDGSASLKRHSCSSSNHSASSSDTYYSDFSYLTVSDISLRTQPLRVPPPSRPPPKVVDEHQIPRTKTFATSKVDLDEGSKRIVDYPKYSEWGAPKRRAPKVAVRDSSCYFDVEMDASSAAAASAAAMKEAMELAQARLKSAKELMERKQDNFQIHKKQSQQEVAKCKKGKEDKDAQEVRVFSEVITQKPLVKENKKKNEFVLEESQKAKGAAKKVMDPEEKGSQVVSDEQGQQIVQDNGSKSSQVSFKLAERSGEWKTDKQFYELVNNEKVLKEVKELSFPEYTEKIPKTTIKVNEKRESKSKEAVLHSEFEINADSGEVKTHGRKETGKISKASSMSYKVEKIKEIPKTIPDALLQEENVWDSEQLKDWKKQRENLEDHISKEDVNKANIGNASACGESVKKLEPSVSVCQFEGVHRIEGKNKKLEYSIDDCFHEDRKDSSKISVSCNPLESGSILEMTNKTQKPDGHEKEIKAPQPSSIREAMEEVEITEELGHSESSERTIRKDATESCQEEIESELNGTILASKQEEDKIQSRTKQAPMVEENELKLKVIQESREMEDNSEKLKSIQEDNRDRENEKIGVKEACQQDCSGKKTREPQVELQQNEEKQKAAEILCELENSEELTVAVRVNGRKEMESVKEVHVAIDLIKNHKIFNAAPEVFQMAVNKDPEDVCEVRVSEKKGNMLSSAHNSKESCHTMVVENIIYDVQEIEERENGTHLESEAEGQKQKKLEEKEREKQKKLDKEKEREKERRLQEEREREREREKDRIAVERATREAHERAFTEARERAERIAVERVTAEARQRALAEAREKAEKASTEALEKSLAEKASREARLRVERAAVERATIEARERAVERALAEKAAASARERAEKVNSTLLRDKTKRGSEMEEHSRTNDREDNGTRDFTQDLQFQSAGSSNSAQRHSESYTQGEGESPLRCKARLERHQRTVERAAKALAEKNMRDILAQREQAERNRLAETLDADVRRWSSGKEGNLRALLSTLQYILGSESGWQPIPLTEVITAAAVKKAYRRATLSVHPDKLQQRGASIQQKYICEKVFDLLKDAWNRFNSEER